VLRRVAARLWHAACNKEGKNASKRVKKYLKSLENKMNKTITTITLAIVLTFGATFANAGILIGDRADSGSNKGSCTNGIIIGGAPIAGILIGDLVAPGILVSDLVSGVAGILIGDEATPSPCKSRSKNGIIIGGAPTASNADAPTGGIIIGG
jgi:hypothetical protein